MNDNGEWLMIKYISETDSDVYNKSDSDSLSNNSEPEYSLLEEEVQHSNRVLNKSESEEENWDELRGMSIGESKLCYSTPMTKNQELNNVHFNNHNSFNTVLSNSDMYKTAIDYNNCDMDISSSCNNSLNVNECNFYKDFLTGRNTSTFEEDISETEKTLTCVTTSHDFSNCDIENANINNTVVNTSNISLKRNCSSDNCHESKLKGKEINEEQPEMSICFNRTLLDESGYTEKLLLTSDKE